jgi:hypothetical protein
MHQFITSAAAMLAFTTPAVVDVCAPSTKVADYLKTQPGWEIESIADLAPDDQSLWQKYHPDTCPGLAHADLHGNGDTSYALVLEKNKQTRLIILLNDHGKLQQTLVGSGPTKSRYVVHSAMPGTTYEFETRKRYDLKQQSFVFEIMEASAEQYYWQDGKLNLVLITD